jgi:hypothetical protein
MFARSPQGRDYQRDKTASNLGGISETVDPLRLRLPFDMLQKTTAKNRKSRIILSASTEFDSVRFVGVAVFFHQGPRGNV